jgi:hydrogenase-1 operon protein HyaE
MNPNTPPLHPLLTRLIDDFGYPCLDRDNLEACLAAPGDSVLFCAGDPVQYPECLDVAVVLPELMRSFPGRFRVALASRELEADMQTRFGFNRWPSLIFLRDGQYVGTLSGMLDWTVYLARIQDLLVAPAGRPPSIGIAVNIDASIDVNSPAHACH